MTAPEPGPERLDLLLDGRAEPEGAAERELVAMARELRDEAPPAPAAVRARVRALSAAPRRRTGPPRSGWGRAALALAPACAIAAVVVVLAQGGGGEGPPALTAAAKAPVAPALEAAPAPASSSALPSPAARARALVAGLEGSVRPAGRDAAGRERLVVRVPAGRVPRARAALGRLGAVTLRPGAPGVLVVTLRG